MKLQKKLLRQMIEECINEMHSDRVDEASSLKPFSVTYKNKKGVDKTVKIKARDKEDALAAARQKLKGRYYDILFARELDEMTTTANVQGYDAPMSLKDLVDDEDNE